MLLKLLSRQTKGAVSLTLKGLPHGPTCLERSIDVALVQLPLSQYEEVVRLGPSPRVVCETVSWGQNLLLQQTSQSRGGLQVHKATL